MNDAAMESREKSKNVKALSALWPFIRRYRLMFFGANAALVSTALMSLILPIAVRRVVDGFETSAVELLDRYFAAALVIAGLLAIGTGVRYYLVSRLGERVVADIRNTIFDRMIGMSPAFYEKIMTGEVLSRITTDTTVVLSVIGSSISVAARNILILFGGLLLLFVSSPKLAGLVLLLVPVIIGPIVLMGRRLRELSRENQDWIANSSGNASEALLSVQAVQAFSHEAESSASFRDVTEQAFVSAKKRIEVRAALTIVVISLVFVGIVGVLWIGARDVRAGEMSVGELVQFVIYAVMVAGAVGSLSEIWGELQRAAGATERLIELIDADDVVEDPSHPALLPTPVKGAVDFKDVVFHYPTRPERAALEDATFSVKPGEVVALVGPSGAGKTTIIQLLLRFYDPSNGSISIDGNDIRTLSRSDFRQHIALVPQEPAIFATSARENIRFGRPDATDAEIEEAARAAAAHDFIMDLPKGYDAMLGERGTLLSGGQRQRIAIARAILRDAEILLLDEATSALDAESEVAVQTAVERLSRDRTTLVVAHRLATVRQADRILVFDEGRIVATGTHESLVAEDGLYARLARLQFTEGLAAE